MRDEIFEAMLAADPVIRRIVRNKLRASLSAADGREHNLDALDVLGEIRLKILRRLKDDPSAVSSFDSYAATVAYNTCSDYLRARYPARTRIRNAIRRTLEKNPDYAVWQSGDWFCGYAGWRHQHPDTQQDWIDRMPPPAGSRNADSPTAVERRCRHVLDATGAPVLLDDLTAWVHRHTGGRDLEHRVTEDPFAAERMRLLWDAIRQLLPWHRAAYLLNLREGELDAFPYYGVAALDDVRQALDLDPHSAAAWPNRSASTRACPLPSSSPPAGGSSHR